MSMVPIGPGRPQIRRPMSKPESKLTYPLDPKLRDFQIAADDRQRANKPEPGEGEVGLVRQTGFWPACIRWATGSHVDHMVVYIGGRMVVSASPKGAKVVPIDDYPNVIWSAFTVGEPDRFAYHARRATLHWAFDHIGTPYNFVDDVVLATVWIIGKLTRVSVPTHIVPRAIARRLSDPRRLQCAQLCDLALQAGGVHVFQDGRLPGDVVPGDFERYFRERGWWPRERGRHRARR